MQSEFAAITTALMAALARLDAHVLKLETGSANNVALTAARDQLAAALLALDQAALDVAPRPSGPTLLDQIVLLKPATADAFRTKVKLKSAEQPTAAALSVVTDGPDDLTRIRGIDVGTARSLAGLGIKTFDAIAGWGQADVQRVSDALRLGRTISRQNWIEQAALLERAKPPGLPTVEQQVIEPTPEVPAEVAATLAIAPPPLVLDFHHEHLGLIKGLSASHHALLRSGGVRRWADIAAWQCADIAHWTATLGADAAITKMCWVEQAALLATGGTTRFANEQISGVRASLVPRPLSEVLPTPIFAPWAVTVPTPTPAPEPVAMPIEVPSAERVLLLDEKPLDGLMPPEIVLETTAPSITASSDVPALDLPTALDRVAALESELASLVANDTAARLSKKAEVTFEPVQRTPPAPFNIEDEEFLELNVIEADVVIVPRNKAVPVATPKPADTVSTRTLLARMRRVPPIEDIEADRYAAYRDRAEEASVEIIRASEPRAERVSAAQVVPPKPVERPIKRLLRNFSRQD